MSEKRKRVLHWFFIVFAAGAFVWLIYSEAVLNRPEKLGITSSGMVDMCITCHRDEKLDPAHDPKVIGCSSCHLGNPLAITEEAAHRDMVLNPGDLRHVEKTCSTEGCHPKDVHKVKNSLMATNRGILGTLLYYWGRAKARIRSLRSKNCCKRKKIPLPLIISVNSAPPATSGNRKMIWSVLPIFSEKRVGDVPPAIIQSLGNRVFQLQCPMTVMSLKKRKSIPW
ncbi:hypothetical protein [Desulfomarina profundi]|nr:hypothetical protein [Desulfomarina profundi]